MTGKVQTQLKASDLQSTKKLSEEALQKSLRRLYEHPCEKKKAKVVSDQKEIDENMKRNMCKTDRSKQATAKDEEICKRLYEQPLAVQKNMLQSLEKRYVLSVEQRGKSSVKMTEEQSEETVHRLYGQSVDHKRQVLEQSEKRIYGEAPQPRKLDAETLKENVSKLYSKAIENKHEKLTKLEGKYVWTPAPAKKIGKTALQEVVTRLGAK